MEETDADLVAAARGGDRAALESLIARHQQWIFNVAVRMVGNPVDAEDVTQEILIKLITRLSRFEMRSSFRTWVYRIVVNHVLAMRRRPWERLFFSFEHHAELVDSLQGYALSPVRRDPAQEALLLQETKTGCLTGMLLCLDRSERIALILGTFFEVSSSLGGEVMETTPENYRQILSRARKRLGSFMNEKCGLMNEANPCRCSRNIEAAIASGLVNPRTLRFDIPSLHRVRELAERNAALVESAVEMRLHDLLRDMPLYTSPDFKRVIAIALRRGDVGDIVNFN